MHVLHCLDCNKEFTEKEIPRRGNYCFKCHLRGISLGFTYGKDDFHGPTVKQRQDKQLAEAAAANMEIQPVGQRWV